MSRIQVHVKENTKIIKFEAFVESDTESGIYYRVTATGDKWECTCPDHKFRGHECKHIEKAKSIKEIDDVQRFD